MKHIPVLLKEVLEGLDLSSGNIVVDATLGLGGHTRQILDRIGPAGKVIGFDKDERNIKLAKENLLEVKDRVEFVYSSFAHIGDYVKEPVDAVLFDLGFSSVHVDDPERGFSFMYDGPLDMRYDQDQALSAETIVNGWSKEDLIELFRKMGEEEYAPQIARAIFDARRKERITRTLQLVEVIETVVHRHGKQHPATKVFQALRIAVNDELGEVEQGLESAIKVLKTDGRIAVITFHSLEDRLVKRFFKASDELEVLTKKPIKTSSNEIKINPRARSAKLRIARKR
ncbi:MAG: Ribosomal RNA small subunit methyltransferase H [uncultured bacterium]|uniref:Ribosomal RNA small subunit methyltransferase H n=1 Tax=Candidatus Uhrbacteria bacterium GW2011_GWC1_41_20 TaxID=1618983 RepID=A0A0G0YF46_9BACT|nr:MAG: Ribosomal RNA small subunit methyltransferase H [uncultured bacterium]KKR22258.1 MAG: S-adenosyl-L-methionine-dependent methyltransferase MraW [Candidatus Uhrbacteria bacterium GW2011_GWE1_39_46]KKR63304.1 MAG: S-adenosyl-L-methionine-dependent methyltransferase MraW [Candidatus Uhrbacteria bacterium GW2011_GWC2_40_450]KKR89097.1 MAG: S-adenosyl-L-methionine-dependent methyltransferase MraW [Candidatus Uhrbacteria bacterium GW2011_GWE2_41_1153]KKR94938.1 MAG: S-adenosyl-L-methionine-dep